MKIQAANLQKAEAEVEALDICLKQLRVLLKRHETHFTYSTELQQFYQKCFSLMGN